MGEIIILSGTNGTGKSTVMKKLLEINSRNIVIPANPYDKAWSSFPKLKPKHRFVLDKKDPKQKRQIMDWYIPNLNTFKGTKVLDVTEMEAMDEDPRIIFKYLCHKFNNGGFFVDDYKNYIHSAGTLPNYVTRIFRDRRHRMLDIFMASHSLSDVNGEFIQFNPKLLIFKVTRTLTQSVKDKFENHKELDQVIARVKKKARTNPYYHELFIPNPL